MLLTWIRVLMIPLLVAIYHYPIGFKTDIERDICGAALFALAAVTDALDGYIARRFAMTSRFGAFLDPVADKLMVCAALVVLVALKRVDVFIALIIIGREITISALREWMALMGAAHSVAVNSLGKIKTIAQMVAIPFLLFNRPLWGFPIGAIGTVLIYVAATLTLYSMLYYLKKAWPHLKFDTP